MWKHLSVSVSAFYTYISMYSTLVDFDFDHDTIGQYVMWKHLCAHFIQTIVETSVHTFHTNYCWNICVCLYVHLYTYFDVLTKRVDLVFNLVG
jgi:hypothetical protein